MHNGALRSAARVGRILRSRQRFAGRVQFQNHHFSRMHAAARPLHIGLGLGCASVKKAAPGEGFLEYAGSALKFHGSVDHEALNARVSESQNQMSLEYVDARDDFSCAKSSCGSHPGAVWIEDRTEMSYVVTEALTCGH